MKAPSRDLLAFALASALLAACGGSSPGKTSMTGTTGDASGGAGAGAGMTGAAGADTGGSGVAGVGAAGAGTGGANAAGAGGTDAAATAGAAGTDAGAPEVAATNDAGAEAGGYTGPVLTGTVKIMVLGSSNEVITCWRAFLWQMLRAAGVTNFDFVGGQKDGPDCNVPGYDMDDESHSGIIITTVPASTFLAEFEAHPPQIVLQHFGGADILANDPVPPIITTYTTVLEQARKVNPNVIYLAAQHTPEVASTCNNCTQNTMQLNADMVPWAAANTTAASPVLLVDLYTGLDTTTDFSDGVHLNTVGAQKVAARWLAALLPILKP